MFDKENEIQHESFGMMGFSRITAHGEVLHGSELKHNTIIAMRLHHAIKRREYGRDWHHAQSQIVEVYMSQNQFSEMITSMNMGDGIPVTIKATERDGHMESPDFASPIELNRSDFKEAAAGAVADAETLLATMRELLGKSGTVKKADREELIKKAEKVVREIGANMPYMEECFEKSMDGVVTDAKGTIEAFYQHRVVEAGLNALADGIQVTAPKLKDDSAE